MPRLAAFLGGALLGGAVLAACTAPRTAMISREHISATYSSLVLNAAGRYDGVALEVVGNPFVAQQADVNRAVLDNVRDTRLAANIPFTLDPPDPRSPYRLVVIFDAASGISHPQVCKGSRRQADTPAGGVRMMMTYCLGEKAVTSLRARQGGLNGPGDPAFGRFVRNATAALFPPTTEIHDTGGRDKGGGFFD